MLAKMLQPTVLIIAKHLATIIDQNCCLHIHRLAGALSHGSALLAITNFAAFLESPNHWATVMPSVYT